MTGQVSLNSSKIHHNNAAHTPGTKAAESDSHPYLMINGQDLLTLNELPGDAPATNLAQMQRLISSSPKSSPTPELDSLFAAAKHSPNPVISSLEPVVRGAEHIKMDLNRLKEVAAEIPAEKVKPADWTFPPYKPENNDKTVDFFMLMNTINFLFFNPENGEKYKVQVGDKEFTGADGMVASLNRALDEGKPVLDANYLAHISKEDMAHIFRGNMELPLLEERRQIFHEVGRVLNEKYDGSFKNLVSAAGGRAFDHGNGMVERLTRDFPSFRDQEGEAVFNKRAQLAVGMLTSRLAGTGQFDTPDVDQLTVFADYQLPRGLRAMGILQYDDALADKVDNGKPIEKGSQMEKEIRAHTIVAAQLLINEMKKRPGFEKLDARGLDSYLWSTARKDKNSRPHVTVTTAY